MQVCLRLCHALKCMLEAIVTVMASESAAKLARIAMKFMYGNCLQFFELTRRYIHTQHTINTKCLNARLALHGNTMLIQPLLQGIFTSHVATLSDLHDVGAYIHVGIRLIVVLLLIALVLSAC